jgi:hypothetical protein
MKAILHEDMIVNIGTGIEVGESPTKGAGLERLRWNGEKLVDLGLLDQFWVRYRNGIFELHAIEVANSQLVSMRYEDRKHLVSDSSIIRVKTPDELTTEKAALTAGLRDNKDLRLELVDLVTNLTYTKIDKHIETVFYNLNAAQEASLKKLYKVVLYLAKSNLRR